MVDQRQRHKALRAYMYTGDPFRMVFCGDITNKQVGISGETVPEAEGGNLCIY